EDHRRPHRRDQGPRLLDLRPRLHRRRADRQRGVHPRRRGLPGDGPRPGAVHPRGGPARRRHAVREDAPGPTLRRRDGGGHGDGDDRHRDRALGPRRQGPRRPGLPPARRQVPRHGPPLLRQPRRQGLLAGVLRPAGAGGGRARLRRDQVRRRRDAGRVPQRPLELARLGGGDRLDGRAGRRRPGGGGADGRPGDRHARPLRHRERDRRGAGDGALPAPVAGGAGAARERGGDAGGEAGLAGAALRGREPLPAVGLPRSARAAGGRLHHAGHPEVRRAVGVPQDRQPGRDLLRPARPAQRLRSAGDDGFSPRLRLNPQLPGDGVALGRLPRLGRPDDPGPTGDPGRARGPDRQAGDRAGGQRRGRAHLRPPRHRLLRRASV
ncbi:MAG: Gluconate dehydratase, partial [uncultured Thermomicrobiales bacterium]